MLELKSLSPFAQGGNRLCFVHPEKSDVVVKVRRPDFTLEDLRRKKGFPKNLKPLSSFDDNLEEFHVLSSFKKKYGEDIFKHVSHCYGFEETDLGKGLCLELIKDTNSLISLNIKQYLYEVGETDSFKKAFQEFCDFWCLKYPPSRSLLAHNILVQQDNNQEVTRLVVVDGLGHSGLIPYQLIPKWLKKNKAAKRIDSLKVSIQSYLDRKNNGESPSQVGILFHRGNDIS
jgi:hypothetical protein